MTSAWVGTIVLGEDWGIFLGDGSVTPMHQHLAFKVVLGLTSKIQVHFGDDRPPLSGYVALIRPQELHAVIATGVRVCLFFFEPQALVHADGRTLAENLEGIAEALRRFDQTGDFEQISNIARAMTLVSKPLQRNLSGARAALAEGQQSIDEVASAVGLSESRLSHLFKQQLGIPPIRFRRWSRLRQATTHLAAGMSITEAALEAGFSDAAHLTRTFTEMLGITPGMFSASRVMVAPSEMP